MKYKIDLDILKKGSLLGNVIPVLFFNFQNELKNCNSTKGRDDYNGNNKRRIIELFEVIYGDIVSIDTPDELPEECQNEYDMDEDNVFDQLSKISSATEMYDNMTELIRKYKEYMEINNIDIVCISSVSTLLSIMKDELNNLRRYRVFDSIEIEMWK